jgi:murein DD-endopeptidase MepM/ murein hydrolase activator NlpD
MRIVDMRNWKAKHVFSGVEGSFSRRFGITAAAFRVVCGSLFIILPCTAFLVFCSFRVLEWRADYESLRTEFEALHRSTENVRLEARQLSERISSFEVSTQKLEMFAGLDKQGLGGAGGPENNVPPNFLFDEGALAEQLGALDKRVISLSERLRKYREYYTARELLISSTPSIMPTEGYPSDRYGMRSDPFTGKRSFHAGMDISSPGGSKVVATADGIVLFAGRQANYGKLVKIRHRFGVGTRYGHLKRVVVEKGQRLKKGDVVGYVGATGRATGPHVHYEVRLNGQSLNPLLFFREEG